MAAGGKLAPEARRMAAARYGQIHLSPAHAGQARRYAVALGLAELGAGLRPATG